MATKKNVKSVAVASTNAAASTLTTITPDNAVITKLVKTNPRQEGTFGHQSFSIIRDGMTVEQFVQKGGRRKDLRWDIAHGNVKITRAARANRNSQRKAA